MSPQERAALIETLTNFLKARVGTIATQKLADQALQEQLRYFAAQPQLAKKQEDKAA